MSDDPHDPGDPAELLLLLLNMEGEHAFLMQKLRDLGERRHLLIHRIMAALHAEEDARAMLPAGEEPRRGKAGRS